MCKNSDNRKVYQLLSLNILSLLLTLLKPNTHKHKEVGTISIVTTNYTSQSDEAKNDHSLLLLQEINILCSICCDYILITLILFR